MNRILLTWKPVFLFCIYLLEIRQLEAEKKKKTMPDVYRSTGTATWDSHAHPHLIVLFLVYEALRQGLQGLENCFICKILV